MVELSKFRFKLFFSHLICSCTVAAITAAIVFLVWHPAPLAKAVGVTHIFLLMLAIDAILGPVLTWTVAKEGKARHLIRLGMWLSATLRGQQATLVIYLFRTVQKETP